jgi:hypothetical protein
MIKVALALIPAGAKGIDHILANTAAVKYLPLDQEED